MFIQKFHSMANEHAVTLQWITTSTYFLCVGFESTLHKVMCSDGQYLSLIRAWNGEQLLCLLEVWLRYFPEVNRSHLSSVLKRLEIDTQVPTSQQTSLLRVAGIISVRSVTSAINCITQFFGDGG